MPLAFCDVTRTAGVASKSPERRRVRRYAIQTPGSKHTNYL